MDEPIEFRSKAVRDWAVIETATLEVLADAVSPDMVSHLVERSRAFFDKMDWDLTVSLPLPTSATCTAEDLAATEDAVRQALAELQEQVQSLTARMLFDRLVLEVEVYRLQQAASGGKEAT